MERGTLVRRLSFPLGLQIELSGMDWGETAFLELVLWVVVSLKVGEWCLGRVEGSFALH